MTTDEMDRWNIQARRSGRRLAFVATLAGNLRLGKEVHVMGETDIDRLKNELYKTYKIEIEYSPLIKRRRSLVVRSWIEEILIGYQVRMKK